MIIFLDTNIFYNNWYLKNANFKLLFNFVSNTSSTIFISEIICDEVNNKYSQAISDSYNTFNTALAKYQKLLNKEINLEALTNENKYNFRDILINKAENLVFYGYESVLNSIVVSRAIKKVKPFQEEDKGFRDTLIWLSFLDYLKSNELPDEIIFINNNSSDFYNDKKNDLHQDLKNDLVEKNIANNFVIFKDLYSFVTSTIDKSKHSFTIEEIKEEIVYENESLIAIELEYYINRLTSLEIVELFGRSNEQKKALAYCNAVKFEVIEGIEDPELSNYEILKDPNLIFIELNFNLRIVEIEYSIPTTIYNENLDLLRIGYYNIEEVGDNTKLYDYLRIDFNISFTFNKELEDIQDLVINSTKILK